MKRLEVFFKGIWIGGTMTVPGVSGGTMAILLGIYDRLIRAINGLVPKRNETKYWPVAGKSLLFLLVFLAGAGGGMFAFAKVISGLLEQPVAGNYVRFFFLGAVAGGIPLILVSAKVTKFSLWCVLLPLVGAALVYGLNFLPKEMFSLAKTTVEQISAFLLCSVEPWLSVLPTMG